MSEPQRPDLLEVFPDGIAEDLKQRPQWGIFRLELNEAGTKYSKVPYQAKFPDRHASSTNPKTWCDFETADDAVQAGHGDGLVFALTKDDPFAVLDMDDCVENDELNEAALAAIERMNTYTEVSPSGAGIHMWCRAVKEGEKSGAKSLGYEFYDRSRFMTVTGVSFTDAPMTIEPRQEEFTALYAEVFPESEKPETGTASDRPTSSLSDDEVISKARSAKNGDKFSRLWSGDTSGHGEDDSRADAALAGLLVFWTDDDSQIDRLMRRSGLKRAKFDRPDYLERTISAARKNQIESYSGAAGVIHHPSDGEGTSSDQAAGERRLVVRSMSDVEEREVEWIMPGWIPKGMLTIFGGYPGDGKSTCAIAIAAACSRSGTPHGLLPDGQPAPDVNTLIFAAEDSAEITLKPRATAHRADPSKMFLVDGTEQGGKRGWIHLKDDVDLIEEIVRLHNIGLVIIDPISAYMTGANRNQEGDVRDSLQPLVQLAESTNAAVVGIAHIGKGSPGFRAAQRIMGATAFIGVARVVIMVDTLPKEHQLEATDDNPEPPKRRVIEVVKSNISVEPKPLMYTIEDRVRWLGKSPMSISEIMDAQRAGDDGELKRDRAAEWLQEFLSEGAQPQQDVETAASHKGIKSATLRRAKTALNVVSSREGGSRGAWYWSLPNTPDKNDEHLTRQTNSNDDQVSTFESMRESPQFLIEPDKPEDSGPVKDVKGAQGDHLREFEHLYPDVAGTCIESGCDEPIAPGNNYHCAAHDPRREKGEAA